MLLDIRSKSAHLKKSTSLGGGYIGNDDKVVFFVERQCSTISTSDSSSSLESEECFHYEYDPKTGLPIFDIDECSDNELLGGEAGFASRFDELQAVHAMRRQLSDDEKKDLTDPRMLIRHWRAEKGDLTRAMQTLREAFQWRKDYQLTALRVCMSAYPNKVTGNKDYNAMMRLENATGKIYVRGTTKEGRALQYMFAMRNNTNSDIDNMRHLAWNLEKSIAVTMHHSQGRLDKICLMIDCTNFDLRKAPSMHASKMTLDLLQKHFKERMHRIYVLNPPLAFRIFWKLVKPFIDPVTKTKIVFCTDPQSEGTLQLHKEVGPDQAKRLENCAYGTEPIRPFDSEEYLGLPMFIGFDQ
jgi:CRAL/TRIO domain